MWATDITYIRLKGGFIYLLVIMDWHSRYVIDFEVSNYIRINDFCGDLETRRWKKANLKSLIPIRAANLLR